MQKVRHIQVPKIPKAHLQVFTKEDFAYKRNNSVLMSTCLTWDWNEESDQIDEEGSYEQRQAYDAAKYSRRSHSQKAIQDSRKNVEQLKGARNRQLPDKRPQTAIKQDSKNRGKPQSQAKPKKDYSKFEKTQDQILQQKKKQQQRRQKIQNYIESMVPYSRTLQDSKFQKFYQRAAPIMYGASNIKEPIGGLVYGNNLRTFNVNPHDYQNNPKTYQSHTTALNFAARCKKNEQKHWKRLQKELGKKLNLHEKNHSLKQGKGVVYVDVNDHNMHELMRQNLQFKRDHRQEIRQSEKDYEHQKELKFQAQKQKFYKNKAQTIQKNLQMTKASNSVPKHDRQAADRISQQVIYKHHDKNGNVRIGADRHALTCFVDINFPQNDGLYTQELKNRLPIYPTKVEQKHKNIAQKKRENYFKSKDSIYPAHYLVPCNQQPEIQKMLIQKGTNQGRKHQ